MTEMLTVKEVAKRLKVHKQTVYGWIANRKLKAHKIDGIIRIKEEEYEEFVGEPREVSHGGV